MPKIGDEVSREKYKRHRSADNYVLCGKVSLFVCTFVCWHSCQPAIETYSEQHDQTDQG